MATTTRSLTGTRKRILLTDTIGFVDGVPFWMVEAFNATLEEILQADLVLLLVDVSDSETEIQRKVRLAARTLFPNDARTPVPNTGWLCSSRPRSRVISACWLRCMVKRGSPEKAWPRWMRRWQWRKRMRRAYGSQSCIDSEENCCWSRVQPTPKSSSGLVRR